VATEVTEAEISFDSEDTDHTHLLPGTFIMMLCPSLSHIQLDYFSDLFKPVPGEPDIKAESVHYVGYFSNHEQSMQKVVFMRSASVETALSSVFCKAVEHCRRDHLWNRMHSNTPTLLFLEFIELLGLTQVRNLRMAQSLAQLIHHTRFRFTP